MKYSQHKKEEIPKWEHTSEERKQMVIPKLPHTVSGKKIRLSKRVTIEILWM